MTDSNYNDDGLISNSNDNFDTSLQQSEKIQFKPLQPLNGINWDTGLTTYLDDNLFDYTDDPDLNWQPDLVGLDDISSVSFDTNIAQQGPVGYAVDMNKGMNYPTGNQMGADNYNVPVQPTQATDFIASQNMQAAAPVENAQNTAASVTSNTQTAAPAQAVTPPIGNDAQAFDDFDLDSASNPALNNSAEPATATQPTAPTQSSQTVQNTAPDDEPKQATDTNQEPKAETLANGITVIWPSDSHIKMGENAHPVVQSSEPVKSDANPATQSSEPVKSDANPATQSSEPVKSDARPAAQSSEPVKSAAETSKADENGLSETSDNFLARNGAGALAPLKQAEKTTATHISNLNEALKTPINDISSQVKTQPKDQNSDDFYDGLDQVANDPDQYERKDFVDINPDTHEINITHAFRKQKA